MIKPPGDRVLTAIDLNSHLQETPPVKKTHTDPIPPSHPPSKAQTLTTHIDQLSKEADRLIQQALTFPKGSSERAKIQEKWEKIHSERKNIETQLTRLKNFEILLPLLTPENLLTNSQGRCLYRVTDSEGIITGEKNRELLIKRVSKVHDSNELDFMEFLEEIEAPFRVPLLMGAEDDTTVYIVIPFYKKGDLIDLAAKRKTAYSLAEIQKIGRELLSYLSYLEEEEVTHLDIKPDNMYLGDNEELCIGDPGHLLAQEDYQTLQHDQLLGSPGYYPIELLLGSKKGCSSDVWSAGISLFNLFTNYRFIEFDDRNDTNKDIKQTQIDHLYQIIRTLRQRPVEELKTLVNPKKIGTEGNEQASHEEPFLGTLFKNDGSLVDTNVSGDLKKLSYPSIADRIKSAADEEHKIHPNDPTLVHFIDLMQTMISWPDQRPSATELLQHPFFA